MGMTKSQNGLTLTVRQSEDYDYESPLDWDCSGFTLACWHRNYSLGHVQPKMSPSMYKLELLVGECDWGLICRKYRRPGESWQTCEEIQEEELVARIEQNPKPFNQLFDYFFIHQPLYLYDHSGITISTSPFSCKWDSGQIGFVYISKEQARNIHGKKSCAEKALKALDGVVKTYDQHLTGDVWFVTITDAEGEYLECIGGYYGYDYAVVEGLAMFKNEVARAKKSREQRIKTFIQNRVPLNFRKGELETRRAF